MAEKKYTLLNKQLRNDPIFGIIDNFSANLDVLENDLDNAILAHEMSTLSTEEHIKLDTYFAYVNSTLFWMLLKLKDSDLSKNYIQHDLRRAKDILAREKEINDIHAAPRLDIVASRRFIASGLKARLVDGVIVHKER